MMMMMIMFARLVCLDITEGQEDVCIPVINTIDDTIITGKFVQLLFHSLHVLHLI